MIGGAAPGPGRPRRRWIDQGWSPGLVLAATLVAAGAAWASSPPICGDPCLQAARGERRGCASSAGGVFLDRLDGCQERDRVCLDACRMEQRDCRDASDLDAALAACEAELREARQGCRDAFLPGTKRWKKCLDHASAKASRCRRRAARDERGALWACRKTFRQCAEGCPPGEPPGGLGECKGAAKTELGAALGECKSDFQLSVAVCIDGDAVCIETCDDERDLCRRSVGAGLLAAIAGCRATRDAAVSQCIADNPDGGEALAACIQTAQATAFECIEGALGAATPDAAACTLAWATCLGACPAP